MSHVTTITCDRCGTVKAEKPVAPWWDFQYTSMDTPAGDGNYEFRSGSWDLCGDCAVVARDAMTEAVGEPRDGSDLIPDAAA